MSELKAKDCPICGNEAETLRITPHDIDARCKHPACVLHAIWLTLDQWNNRPREETLESELAQANKWNDTGLPLDEVMAGIHDALLPITDDKDSPSSGNILSKTEAAVDLALKNCSREREIEQRLESSAIALRLLSDTLRNRNEASVTETSVQQCVQIAGYEISAINAVLGKGGE